MSERTQLLRLFLGNLLRYVIIPLVLIGLIVFIIWFLFIRDETAIETPNDTTQTTQSDSSRKAESDTSTDDSSSNEGASTSNDSNGATSSNTSGGSASSNTQDDTQELANSGPGDVLAIFLVVALFGAGAHHAYRAKNL